MGIVRVIHVFRDRRLDLTRLKIDSGNWRQSALIRKITDFDAQFCQHSDSRLFGLPWSSPQHRNTRAAHWLGYCG
ncbi:hypothetical protein AGABI2DRAFT_139448, partial [Agaricus bisporus var. bisporus H97]|uniref:hypothetical protein n=1 Tax=Agaricus bisporus var. bisporus (strain H97 / ATCC MYA-4626 / FGSC 10389) TaxID=936046 RepID=UPI00029F5A26